MKSNKKQIYKLVGKMESICIIMQEVRQELLSIETKWKTEPILVQARESSSNLRRLLRKISYEVEDVREDS